MMRDVMSSLPFFCILGYHFDHFLVELVLDHLVTFCQQFFIVIQLLYKDFSLPTESS